MRVSHATMFMLLSFASIARADTVRLRNGRTIENVQVSEEGKTLRLTSDHGSILVPSSEVLEVVPRALRLEELADRRRAAGDDPAALRALATWCAQSGFPREERDLLALARGIELDRDLEAIRSTAMPAPFVALARRMKRGGYSTSEREFVLRQALARDPESAEARRALQEVERDAQLERAVLARAADASGRAPRASIAPRAGRDRDPLLSQERARAERAEAEAQVARAEAEQARLRAQRPAAYVAPRRRRHVVHYTWDPPHPARRPAVQLVRVAVPGPHDRRGHHRPTTTDHAGRHSTSHGGGHHTSHH
jgi:hypothetical protein